MALVWLLDNACYCYAPSFHRLIWASPHLSTLSILSTLAVCATFSSLRTYFVIYLQQCFRLGVCLQDSLSKKILYWKDLGALIEAVGAQTAGCRNGQKPPVLKSWIRRSLGMVSQQTLGLHAGIGGIHGDR